MTITENYFRKREAVLMNEFDARRLTAQATAAILGGINSRDWVELMNQFADSPEQLSRLSGLDGTTYDPRMNEARAYLVSNSFFGLDRDSAPSYLRWLDVDQAATVYNGQERADSTSFLNERSPNVGASALVLTSRQLTPELLLNSICPFVAAVAALQHLMDQTQGKSHREVTINSITQNSPIELSLNGAADAIEQIRATVVPWRRKHAEKMARLMEQEKRTEIKSKEAEILETQGHAIKDNAEAQKILAEAEKQRAEAESTRLGNEKLRLELQRAKIQLALEMIAQVVPNLSETDKIGYLVKLLPPLETLISTELLQA
jgi:hypothetical protein